MTFVTCNSHVNLLSIVTPRSLNEVTEERFSPRRERAGGGGGGFREGKGHGDRFGWVYLSVVVCGPLLQCIKGVMGGRMIRGFHIE